MTAYLITPDNQRHALADAITTIGRQAPADIALAIGRVSRQHAQITATESGYFLTDLRSRNGTFVNGNAVGTDPVRLLGGDEIVLGGVIALTFEDPNETVQGPMLGKLDGVWIDPQSDAVWVDAQQLQPALSVAQLTLLKLLHANGQRIVSRAEIISTVWPDVDATGVSGEAIDGLIKRLRKRLREGPLGKDYIDVVRGHGIRLKTN